MDLYSGLPFWIAKNRLYDYYCPLERDLKTDIVILGSGITGALIAHELCKAGIQCTMIDKRGIGTGSSSACTALLQYEIDTPLSQMAGILGQEHAAKAYHASLKAISDLEKVFIETGLDVGFKSVPTVFYASDSKGKSLIEKEHDYRTRHQLPSQLLDKKELHRRFGLKAPNALYNETSAQMDAYRATTGLIDHHRHMSKMEIYSHTNIVRCQEKCDGYVLRTEKGNKIRCRYVIIAAGYEAEPFLPQKVMNLTSTYALISQPVHERHLWAERSLLWETRQPYLYIRTTGDNRIIVGGEDEPFRDPVLRDKLLRKKVHLLEKKFRKLFPEVPFTTDMAWCGTFSSTSDGLPFIGTWPGKDRMFFALGYGGNGVVFSMIAAQMIRNRLLRIKDKREELFGFGRKYCG